MTNFNEQEQGKTLAQHLAGIDPDKPLQADMTEQKRTDGKRSWITKDYKVIVYDPEVCSPKHFEAETGIKL